MDQSKVGRFGVLLLGLSLFYLVIFWNAEALDTVTASFVELRSEYTAVEQLTKFSLIVIMMVTFFSLNFDHREYHLKAAASLFALGVTIYLSESNMIRDKYQPVFGMLLILPTAYWMLRGSSWVALSLFCAGIFVTAMGSLKDMIHESTLDADKWVPLLIQTLIGSFNEEIMDACGIALLMFAALVSTRSALTQLMLTHSGSLVVILLSAILVAIGNGLGHYQYHPSVLLILVGFTVSFLGLMILWFVEKFYLPEEYRISSSKRYYYYLPVAILFVLLPFFWHKFNNFTSVFFWVSSIVMGRALYKKAVKQLS